MRRSRPALPHRRGGRGGRPLSPAAGGDMAVDRPRGQFLGDQLHFYHPAQAGSLRRASAERAAHLDARRHALAQQRIHASFSAHHHSLMQLQHRHRPTSVPSQTRASRRRQGTSSGRSSCTNALSDRTSGLQALTSRAAGRGRASDRFTGRSRASERNAGRPASSDRTTKRSATSGRRKAGANGRRFSRTRPSDSRRFRSPHRSRRYRGQRHTSGNRVVAAGRCSMLGWLPLKQKPLQLRPGTAGALGRCTDRVRQYRVPSPR